MPNFNNTPPRQTKHARSLRSNPTDAESLLWGSLRKQQLDGFRFRRQHPIGPFIADFACLAERLLIEVDGGQHTTQTSRDQQRDEKLRSLGYRTLRFWNHEVLGDLDLVLERIRAELPGHLPQQDSP